MPPIHRRPRTGHRPPEMRSAVTLNGAVPPSGDRRAGEGRSRAHERRCGSSRLRRLPHCRSERSGQLGADRSTPALLGARYEAPDPRDERGVMIVLFAIVLPLLLITRRRSVGRRQLVDPPEASADEGGRRGLRRRRPWGFPCGDRLGRPESSPTPASTSAPTWDRLTRTSLRVTRSTRRSEALQADKIHVVLNGSRLVGRRRRPRSADRRRR